MITVEEYKQLKAYARLDGALLGVIMCATFFASVATFSNPAWQLASMIGMVAVPVFVAFRVRNYRDNIVQKRVSFRRAAAYSMHCFGYASLVLAIVMYVYFQYFDHGMMLASMKEYFSAPEVQKAMKAYNVEKSVFDDMLATISSQRPIDVAFSMISNTLFTGLGCSILIAVISKRSPRAVTGNNN